jgi:HEAT repeat protein
VPRDQPPSAPAKPDDPRGTTELIQVAVRSAKTGNNDQLSATVGSLRQRGTLEVLQAASDLCRSADAHERFVGASVLAQLGAPEIPFARERFEVLSDLISTEKQASVLGAAATAIGQLNLRRAFPILLRLQQHPNPEVRFGVVTGLLSSTAPEAIQTLIDLSTDKNNDIRNWATFGLGSLIDSDTPAIREALLARVEDEVAEIRGEALVGLASRRDSRAIPFIVKELSSASVTSLAVEAAAEAADQTLVPALLKLAPRWKLDADLLQTAINNCRTGRKNG